MADDFVTAWRAAVMPWWPSLLTVPRHEFLPNTSCAGGRHRNWLQRYPSTVTGPHGARIAIGQRVPGCQWRYWPWAVAGAVQFPFTAH
jgi:hypothetical protein